MHALLRACQHLHYMRRGTCSATKMSLLGRSAVSPLAGSKRALRWVGRLDLLIISTAHGPGRMTQVLYT